MSGADEPPPSLPARKKTVRWAEALTAQLCDAAHAGNSSTGGGVSRQGGCGVAAASATGQANFSSSNASSGSTPSPASTSSGTSVRRRVVSSEIEEVLEEPDKQLLGGQGATGPCTVSLVASQGPWTNAPPAAPPDPPQPPILPWVRRSKTHAPCSNQHAAGGGTPATVTAAAAAAAASVAYLLGLSGTGVSGTGEPGGKLGRGQDDGTDHRGLPGRED